MCEQRAKEHLELLLAQAERELDRRAGIITFLADTNARLRLLAEREAPEPQRTIMRWSEAQGWHRVEDTGTDRHDRQDAA